MREQITGDLPSDEIIKAKILVERSHDPVAVRVDSPTIIQMEAMSIAVANGIQPKASLVLAEPRAGEQLVDVPLVGILPSVIEKGVELIGFGRESCEHESGSTRERDSIRFGGKVDAGGMELCCDEGIDNGGGLGGGGIGWCTFDGSDESPMAFVLATLSDPARQKIAFLLGQLSFGVGRRHRIVGIMDA